MSKLKVTLKRSLISRPSKIRASARCLGLKKINKSVLVENVPAIRGLVKKVIHLVDVEEEK
jgi:large subunit ribosomal protein L30